MSRDPRYYEPDPIKAPRAADSAAPTPAPAPPGAAGPLPGPAAAGPAGDTDPPTADAPPPSRCSPESLKISWIPDTGLVFQRRFQAAGPGASRQRQGTEAVQLPCSSSAQRPQRCREGMWCQGGSQPLPRPPPRWIGAQQGTGTAQTVPDLGTHPAASERGPVHSQEGGKGLPGTSKP
ncbi:translation initiation factor IF-2-like isoform X1 [Motacilla alba alba]|uniref:translation initiation factor IF-2-like isoform X1 n=1 Tax=Motacilla alba alba TaxID=1094192 RepID=UPI0018D50629|nr:translation initiation factor IF-2-like isoform X1 [Motacilla alba alba]